MTLSELCDTFATEVERLNSRDEDYPTDLRALTKQLIRDAAEHVEVSQFGEVPTLLESSRIVLAWLSAEDPENRQRRYGRQQAVLNLLTLCEGIRRLRVGTRKSKNDAAAALREAVADSLRGLVPVEPT